MKKTLIFMLFCVPTIALAEECSFYELKGSVRDVKNYLHYFVAEKTGSEIDLIIPIEIQTEFSPYVNKFSGGFFIVEGKDVQTRKRIMKVEKIDFALLDPINQNQDTAFKKIKEVVCPKLSF